MIYIVIDGQYYINYLMIIIEVIFSGIFLYVAHKLIMTSLLDDSSQEAKRSNFLSVSTSLLIVLAIGIVTRLIIGYLGYFSTEIRAFDKLYLSLAIMATLFFPFYIIFLKKNDEENLFLKSNKLRKIFLIRALFLIIASWITFLLFLSIDLLGIPLYDFIPEDPQSPNYDIFLLGFEWAFLTVIFDVVLTRIIIMFLPSKKIPSIIVVKKATIVSSISAFGFWSIQLFIVELYLGRYFGIYLSIGGILGIILIILVVGIFIFAPEQLPLKTVLMIVFLLISACLSIISGIIYPGITYYIYSGITSSIIQDIRILFAVVSGIFFISFYVSTHYFFLPKEREERKKQIKEFIEKEEAEAGKVIEQEVVLDVQDLTTRFFTEEGLVYAVEGISFKVYKGEVLGFVGETGCGKSVSALSIVQLIQPPGKIVDGRVNFLNEDLLKKSSKEILSYRGDKITMIFQDPINSLNPVFTVGKQISEVFLLHKKEELIIESSNQKNKGLYDIARERTLQILKDLNIPSPESVVDRYPHELSGGMRQRIQIAMAIACSPILLIADEPTTALDVTVQNQILKLMKDLQKDYNTSIIFITHDLSVISKMCDRVAVMYCGSIVEYGSLQNIFKKTLHPYTRGLLAAVPIEGKKDDLKAIPGMIPNPIYPPKGCKFHPRCEYCFEPCMSEIPESRETEPNYFVACHLYNPRYKKIEQTQLDKIK